jgi:hypothetical protein
MDSRESQPIAAALARRVEQGAQAAQIATMIVRAWGEIDIALSPIIGQRAVAALYKRCLYLTETAYPWPVGMHDGIQTAVDLAPLESLLAQRGSAESAARGGALLQTFCDLLTSLLGPSLTERLLHSVWANLLSGPPAQDTSQ